MKKSIIYIALIFAVFGCKDEEIQEPSLLSLIPGKYGLTLWSETKPGTNNSISQQGLGGAMEVSIDANNLINLRGRPTGNQDFVYFPKFSYKESESLRYDLFQQKNDVRRSGWFLYDKSGLSYDKSIIRVAIALYFTDSLGRVYEIGGEKLGK
jgi:hypothetical protein